MPKSLTEDVVKQYREQGYYFPLKVIDDTRTAECRANLEAFAIAAGGGAPYPFSDAELTGNIAVFEAICASVESGAPEPVG